MFVLHAITVSIIIIIINWSIDRLLWCTQGRVDWLGQNNWQHICMIKIDWKIEYVLSMFQQQQQQQQQYVYVSSGFCYVYPSIYIYCMYVFFLWELLCILFFCFLFLLFFLISIHIYHYRWSLHNSYKQ